MNLTPEQKATLQASINEYVAGLYRKRAETELLKAICDNMKEVLQLEPKLFRKLCNIAFKANAQNLSEENEELFDLAEKMGLYSNKS